MQVWPHDHDFIEPRKRIGVDTLVCWRADNTTCFLLASRFCSMCPSLEDEQLLADRPVRLGERNVATHPIHCTASACWLRFSSRQGKSAPREGYGPFSPSARVQQTFTAGGVRAECHQCLRPYYLRGKGKPAQRSATESVPCVWMNQWNSLLNDCSFCGVTSAFWRKHAEACSKDVHLAETSILT